VSAELGLSGQDTLDKIENRMGTRVYNNEVSFQLKSSLCDARCISICLPSLFPLELDSSSKAKPGEDPGAALASAVFADRQSL
jgi:hypothetical protein